MSSYESQTQNERCTTLFGLTLNVYHVLCLGAQGPRRMALQSKVANGKKKNKFDFKVQEIKRLHNIIQQSM